MANTKQLPSPIVSNFPFSAKIQCRPKRVNRKDWKMTDRQERFSWWDQSKIRKARVVLVGCGGLGSNQAKILVQMGVGRLLGIDPDLAEDSNRNRQLFTAEDVGKPKAHRMLHNLEPYAVHSTVLRGYYSTFEKWTAACRQTGIDAICCGVDSKPTMVAVAKYALQRKIPVIYTNVSKDGEALKVYIQRYGENDGCFGCYMPQALVSTIERDGPCTPAPAIADILQVAVGLGARATVSEILGVPIGEYNCRTLTMGGIDMTKTVTRRVDCPLCKAAL